MNKIAPNAKALISADERSRRYYLWTVGCQMNMADSARLEAALQQVGYTPASQPAEAGFIVLNSCSVRASAEQRVLGKLGDLQQIKRLYPATQLVLWGCMVQPRENNASQASKALLALVDHLVAPSAFEQVVALATTQTPLPSAVLPLRDPKNPPVSAYIPIQYGCNMTCSYCVIPARRGKERSRPLLEIVTEAEQMLACGVKEIILLGQIVDSWGHDLAERPTLADLLGAVHAIPNLVRLRFLTSHPRWLSEQLITTLANLPRCQPEINLPLQTGHDAVLKLMRRGYTVAQYRALVAQIRLALPDVALTTDIIVGHPGETAEYFEQTLALIKEIRFDKIHCAAFSARPGTLAAELELDPTLAVAEAEKETRRRTLDELQKELLTESNARWLAKEVEVLVEDQVRGKWRGRTGQNKLVFFAHPAALKGQLVKVRITKTSPWALQGEALLSS